MAVVNTLVGDALALHQPGLPANLGGDFVVRETGGGENRDLLAARDRVHRVDSRDTGRNHFFGVNLHRVSLGPLTSGTRHPYS